MFFGVRSRVVMRAPSWHAAVRPSRCPPAHRFLAGFFLGLHLGVPKAPMCNVSLRLPPATEVPRTRDVSEGTQRTLTLP